MTLPSRPSPADQVSDLLDTIKPLLVSFIRQADVSASTLDSAPHASISRHNGADDIGTFPDSLVPGRPLVESHPPEELTKLMAPTLDLPTDGLGKDGLVGVVREVLKYSVNTWDQGFMDKLYSSTDAIGVAAELILAVLNTNVHVYQVSPALTLIEKTVTRRLAALFNLGPSAGGISQPGGSASNASSLVIARNTLYPRTKTSGINGTRYVLFTSEHGHYSLEKAAQMFGFGSDSVIPVPVDGVGRLIPGELDRLVRESKERGDIPLYVNATAGTTVLGSYDPFDEIADVCERHGMWMHIDGSWGGCVVFDKELSRDRLKGTERAHSIAVTPHKMLGVPVTSSFLLVKDLKWAWESMTLPAGYLFHNDPSSEIYDLADLTPQCGRRGDPLKLFLSWSYHGTTGLSSLIRLSFSRASLLLDLVKSSPHLSLASPDPLPCLQVCFYFAPQGALADDETNTRRTKEIVARLVGRGFMVDYAPGPRGYFLRVVIHGNKEEETVRRLVRAVEQLGEEVVREERV